MKVSHTLYQFFQEWHEWATSGNALNRPEFLTFVGLCANLVNWAEGSDLEHRIGELEQEMSELLEFNFGEDFTYPFGGIYQYCKEMKDFSCHCNHARLAFVKKILDGGV